LATATPAGSAGSAGSAGPDGLAGQTGRARPDFGDARGERAAIEPPRPRPDELTAPFWDGCRRHSLLIQRCRACGHYIHWPRPVCRFCLSTDLAPEPVSGRATLYTYTLVNQAFHPYYLDKLPYLIATVELVEQPKLMFFTRLTVCQEEDLALGAPFEVVYEDAAPDLTFPLFRPVTSE
jgi:uncharacterized OB-fold protein